MVKITFDFVGMVFVMLLGCLLLVIFPLSWLPSALIAYFEPSYDLNVSNCGADQVTEHWVIHNYGVCNTVTAYCLLFSNSDAWAKIDSANRLGGRSSNMSSGATSWLYANACIIAGIAGLALYLLGFFAMFKPSWANPGMLCQLLSLIFSMSCFVAALALTLNTEQLQPSAWENSYFKCDVQITPSFGYDQIMYTIGMPLIISY